MHVKPAGETAAVRVTVPVKPFRGATVTVDVAPPVAVTEVGLAETLKSSSVGVTTTVNDAELVIAPVAASVPVTVAV